MAHFRLPDRSLPVRWRGCLEGLLPDEHLARFIWDVLSTLDFSEFEAKYPAVHGGPGRPPYHPRLLASLWIYGMAVGLETATGIAFACAVRDDFKWLAGGLCPCDQTLLNFISRGVEGFPPVWLRVLLAMQDAGLIDLSRLVEDGTKVRASASPQSFRTEAEIAKVVTRLGDRLRARVAALVDMDDADQKKRATAEVHRLEARLARAEHGKRELAERLQRRGIRVDVTDAEQRGTAPVQPTSRFKGADFNLAERGDGLVCPAGEQLRLIGEYGGDGGGRYRLYGRSNCSACPLLAQCTTGRGRRVKRPVDPPSTPMPVDTAASVEAAKRASPPATSDGYGLPSASITEPECVFMKATSEKNWAPCYNADLTVTRDGIVVSQFLTKDVTDYHHFAPALSFVLEHLGTPEEWLGDGHYGTEANIVLAHQRGVLLYAPRAGQRPRQEASTATGSSPTPGDPAAESARFQRVDFTRHADRDAYVCPAGKELPLIGEYPNDSHRGTYLLYGRRGCTGCELQHRCTTGDNRRFKVQSGRDDLPARSALREPTDSQSVAALTAFEARMSADGVAHTRARGAVIEPVNAQLKLHGLPRLRVRGLRRSGVVLALACVAHNLLKWNGRVLAENLSIAAK